MVSKRRMYIGSMGANWKKYDVCREGRRSARAWMVFLALLLMTGCCASAREMPPAEVSADGWTARAEDGFIVVAGEDGLEFARIEYAPEEYTQSVLLAADYNFDGMADLAALKRMGTANGYFFVWLRTAEGGFERCEPMEE